MNQHKSLIQIRLSSSKTINFLKSRSFFFSLSLFFFDLCLFFYSIIEGFPLPLCSAIKKLIHRQHSFLDIYFPFSVVVPFSSPSPHYQTVPVIFLNFGFKNRYSVFVSGGVFFFLFYFILHFTNTQLQ